MLIQIGERCAASVKQWHFEFGLQGSAGQKRAEAVPPCRTEMTRTEISRLETAANKNPTINSLQWIASALGKELIVSLR